VLFRSVYLADVEFVSEQKTMQRVDKFTPMNLKWSYTGKTTREVLLPDIPIFCDFIHVGDPTMKAKSSEDLAEVPPDKAVICLDIEAVTSGRGDLLAPGTYDFHLKIAAGECPARSYTLRVWFPGEWFIDQEEMFEKGFSMENLKR